MEIFHVGAEFASHWLKAHVGVIFSRRVFRFQKPKRNVEEKSGDEKLPELKQLLISRG